MKYHNYAQIWSAIIIDQFIKAGVRDFFCCPGMRNAPLLRAIHLHPQAKAYFGFDERAQSYRAMGFIKSSFRPAALVCTSGTAVANFLPATIEAQKTHIPLIIISADRPGELNATDANQTINQIEVLRDYCKNFWSVSEPQATFPPRALAGKISYLLHEAIKSPAGPLHMNVPLREPLDDTDAPIDSEWLIEAKHLIEMDKNSLEFPQTSKSLPASAFENLTEKIIQAKRPLIVFGPLHELGPYDKSSVTKFISSYGANFSCDITSGLKYLYGADDGLLPTFDHPEVLKVLEEQSPDLIVHFGHRLTSKHYYPLTQKLLKNKVTKDIILVSSGNYHEDPGFSFTERWDISPNLVLDELSQSLSQSSNKDKAGSLRNKINWNELIKTKRTIIEESPISYPFITKRAVDSLTNAKLAFIGNSTFVRSFDSYAGTYGGETKWQTITNRGASGIEGHLSMCTGIQDAMPGQATVAFIGDVSFIHDMNALLVLKETYTEKDCPLLVIIANNKGGGIFNLLPIGQQNQKDSYLPLLTTPHNIEMTSLIKATGLPATKVSTKEEYQVELDKWNKNPTLLFLEILFNDKDNVEVYKKLRTVKL